MNTETLLNLIFQSHTLLQSLESTPHDYGTGELLYSSEIHTIVAIGKRGNCNLSDLAKDMGISKPAASKFITRLVKSGYAVKNSDHNSRREVSISLTEKGCQAVEGHDEFIGRMFGPLRDVEETLSKEELAIVGAYLSSLISECPWK